MGLSCRWGFPQGAGGIDNSNFQQKMSESPQQVGLSSPQWLILLFAFVLGVASVFALDKIAPVQGPSTQVVQAATNDR